MSKVIFTTKVDFFNKEICAEVLVQKINKEVLEDFKTLRVFYNGHEFTDQLTVMEFKMLRNKVAKRVDENISDLLEKLQ